MAQGIYGERWFEEARWFYKKYRGLEFHSRVQTDEERAMQAEIEAIRDEIRQPLKLLQDKLDSAKNGRDIATALFELIDKRRVEANTSIEDLHSRLSSVQRELREKMDSLEENLLNEFRTKTQRVDEKVAVLEKWKWVFLGGCILVGFLLTKNWSFLHLLKF